jgi:REP element-mobilizing transposase RayT
VTRHRDEEAGALHHAYARGAKRQHLFLDEEDYERYIRMLAKAVARFNWVLLGFCLMPNHVHLLIETRAPNLGAGMQWLHSLYAQSFNDRHGKRGEGHVFQGPYGSRRVRDDAYFLRVAAHVVANAASAGLCERPEDWPWSSLAVSRRRPAPTWLAHDLLCERLRSLTDAEDFVSTMVL